MSLTISHGQHSQHIKSKTFKVLFSVLKVQFARPDIIKIKIQLEIFTQKILPNDNLEGTMATKYMT